MPKTEKKPNKTKKAPAKRKVPAKKTAIVKATSNKVQLSQKDESIISNIVLRGDISGLQGDEKARYYNLFCKTLGLNPVTRPFEIITFQGKQIMYARKDATEQLRKVNCVSITSSTQEIMQDIFIVKVAGIDKQGRTDSGMGAVSIGGLNGEKLANAMMKAETKAKRRMTLSICGLGMLDETELDSVNDSPDELILSGIGGVDDKERKEMITELFRLKDRLCLTTEQLEEDAKKICKCDSISSITTEQAFKVVQEYNKLLVTNMKKTGVDPLDQTILDACSALGYSETALNQIVQGAFPKESDWKKLAMQNKKQLLKHLNKKIDEQNISK